MAEALGAEKLAAEVDHYLVTGGALARVLPAFRERDAQRRMAAAVAGALDGGDSLLLEAGTGTGKTMAYLLPVLLSGKRAVVSTGTKNLQDQLYHRDLPRLLRVLDQPVRTALLKGRANYLCRYRLKQAAEQPGPDTAAILSLRQFMEASESGELSDYGRMADDDPLRPRVTSTADNCLGTRCPDYDNCFVFAARRRALEADIVVVNHHLLFADFAIREAGFNELLPGAEAVIIDEAHQLPELAAQAFGERLSTRQIAELLRELRQWAGPEHPALGEALDRLAMTLRDLESCCRESDGRVPWADFVQGFGVADSLKALQSALREVGENLGPIADDEEGRRLGERATEQATLLARLMQMDGPAESVEEAADVEDGGSGDEAEELIRWMEPAGQGAAFCASPADVSAAYARAAGGHPGAWIYVSATLSVDGDFSLFRGQLGIDEAAHEEVLPPVFDYARQMQLWLPDNLPPPGDHNHTRALLDAVLPVLQAAEGGAFLLMTTHRAVREAAALLRRAGDFQLFVQNEDDRARLLEGFACSEKAVLIGAASFWEGVDVPGQALRIVVIDKLPFAPPDDPVVQARRAGIAKRGGNAFMDYQLPQAILSLRQGVGRLIRSEADRGLLVLGDPRIQGARYGRKVLAALPEMPRCADSAGAQAYARSLVMEAPV
ncbi:ATP-dependent DNA helicase [Algiphilus aromaticivorans]|uniref:ATP-dependent DNA helicase n=1 Tax=Algiphilus aromaticivorans TaxID=382454 RepID=UPI0006945159|nr:ATP-dependent DNA helicase [Algiphilus aromaticivorans]